MSATLPTPKDSGEAVEAIVCQDVDALRFVGEPFDTVTTTLVEPADDLRFVGINLLPVNTDVEIKAAQMRLSSGARGRYFIRQRQHESLVTAAGAYLFAVYIPRPGHPVVAKAIVAATTVDGILPDGWTPVAGDRCEVGYRQLAWSRIFDACEVEQ